MLGLFKPDVVYVRMYHNRIYIKNLKTGLSTSKEAYQAFSNDRLIISNFINAEKLLKELLNETCSKRNVACTMLIQPISESIKEYSEVELRTFRDSAEHAHAKEVYVLHDSTIELSDTQVLETIQRLKNKPV